MNLNDIEARAHAAKERSVRMAGRPLRANSAIVFQLIDEDVPALASDVLALVERVRELESQKVIPVRHSPPYQFILAEQEIRELSDDELARNLLIHPLGYGKGWLADRLQNMRIDEYFASILAANFGTSIELWLNLQRNYDEWLAAKKAGSEG